jgi:hypothetical protein
MRHLPVGGALLPLSTSGCRNPRLFEDGLIHTRWGERGVSVRPSGLRAMAVRRPCRYLHPAAATGGRPRPLNPAEPACARPQRRSSREPQRAVCPVPAPHVPSVPGCALGPSTQHGQHIGELAASPAAAARAPEASAREERWLAAMPVPGCASPRSLAWAPRMADSPRADSAPPRAD